MQRGDNSWCAAALKMREHDGGETVQLYLAPPRKVAFAPPQILTGFARRTLAGGGGGNYLHSCAAGMFLLQSAGKWKWRAAFMKDCAGASSRDIRLRAANQGPGDDVPGGCGIGRPVPTMPKVDGVFKKEFSVFWVGRFHAAGRRRKESIRSIPCRKAGIRRAGRAAAVFGVFCVGAAGGCAEEARAWALVTQSPLRQAVQGGVPLWLIRLLLRLCNGRRRAVQKK